MTCDIKYRHVSYVFLILRPGGLPLPTVDPMGLRVGKPLTEPGLITAVQVHVS